MPLEIIVGLVFALTVGFVLAAFYTLEQRSGGAARRHVEDRIREAAFGVATDGPAEPDGSVVKTGVTGPLPGIERAARQTERGSALGAWLEQSGLKISLMDLLVVMTLLAIAFGVIASALGSGLAGLAAAAAGFVVPVLVVKQRRTSRLYRFEEYFPEALDLMSRAVRAGQAFSAGMKMAADELEDPVGQEFRATFDEQNFGLPLKDALANLVTRMPLLDVRFFVTAVLIQRETGGNLAEILDNLAGVVRERFKIRRQVRVHTAHGRMTGYVLMALPAFLAVALSFINPEHIGLLFEEEMGRMMLGGAIVMQVVGYLWIQQVVKIEV